MRGFVPAGNPNTIFFCIQNKKEQTCNGLKTVRRPILFTSQSSKEFVRINEKGVSDACDKEGEQGSGRGQGSEQGCRAEGRGVSRDTGERARD